MSVFDVLSLLIADPTAVFFSCSPVYSYAAINGPKQQRAGYPTHVADSNTTVPFSALVWDDKYLTLSVKAEIDGYIDLKPVKGKTAADLDLPTRVRCRTIRTHTVIKDDKCYWGNVPVNANQGTMDAIGKYGCMVSDNIIDFGALPLVRPDAAMSMPSALALARLAVQQLRLKCHVKTFRILSRPPSMEEDGGDEDGVHQPYNDHQLNLFKANGVNPYTAVFTPPLIRTPTGPEVSRPYFEITIRASGIPSVAEVRARIAAADTGQLNMTQSFVAEALTSVNAAATNLEKTTAELANVTNTINMARWAIAVGGIVVPGIPGSVDVIESIGKVPVRTVVQFTLGKTDA